MEEITDSNTLARVNASGSIWYVRELTSKFRCSMNLQHYPMGMLTQHMDLFVRMTITFVLTRRDHQLVSTSISRTMKRGPIDSKKLSYIFEISDIQECPVQFESFKYNESFMNFSWLASAIEFGKGVHFASFSLLQIKYNNCSAEDGTGRYPCQEVRFVLQRKLGYFFIQV